MTSAHASGFDPVDPAPAPLFVRGDVNQDGDVDVSDPVQLLLHLFGNVQIQCAAAADFSDEGKLTISSAIYGLSYLFVGGEPPPAPFPGCGPDATPDLLISCRFSVSGRPMIVPIQHILVHHV